MNGVLYISLRLDENKATTSKLQATISPVILLTCNSNKPIIYKNVQLMERVYHILYHIATNFYPGLKRICSIATDVVH